jgi:hypothetical protein
MRFKQYWRVSQQRTAQEDGFTAEFYQTFKELTLILLKLSHKLEPKSDKDITTTTKEYYRPVSFMNIVMGLEIIM